MRTYDICCYNSPLGGITLACDEKGLLGLWFDGQKYFGGKLLKEGEAGQRKPEGERPPALEQAVRWLDIYFSGREPDFMPPLHLEGSDFQIAVWQMLLEIPYGKTTTYKQLADKIAEQKGLKTMSAQAVGGAVGRNPISVIVPCHRVLGSDGSLTGYAGGTEKKSSLLTLEKAVFCKH
nr:methylated-DNA--[protein]-cysteine S-methyltransferase [uncultured Mediterraneibacter sp.]